MILIQKTTPPPGLILLKQQAEEAGMTDKEGYDLLNNPLKTEVRESLMREQGHLCAYCMRRIPDERIENEDTDLSDVYIEHWKARSANNTTGENEGLDYNNMLAVCSGNEKAPEAIGRRKKRFLTCDKKRGNSSLTINPLDPATIDTLIYLTDGTICSSDAKIDNDIKTVLNLNCSSEAVSLPQLRKAVLDEVQASVDSENEDLLLQNCKEQLLIWENEGDPRTPYIGIAIWWLREQINALMEA